MPNELKTKRHCVGLKQSIAAVADGFAEKAYVAEDADEHITAPFCELCREKRVPLETVPDRIRLGKACGIGVGAACAVLLKEHR